MKAIAMFFAALLFLAAPSMVVPQSRWTATGAGGSFFLSFVNTQESGRAMACSAAVRFKARYEVSRPLEGFELPRSMQVRFRNESPDGFGAFIQFRCVGDSVYDTTFRKFWPVVYTANPPVLLTDHKGEWSELEFFFQPDSVERKVRGIRFDVDLMHGTTNAHYKFLVDEIRFVYQIRGLAHQDSVVLVDNMEDETSSVGEGFVLADFWLGQNYPNPFNPETTIKYQLAGRSEVSLKVYNLLGQEVATLVNTVQEPGVYRVQWNGINRLGQKVATGVYLFQLKAGDFTMTRKMVMMK